jgi:tRNA nucleotidyltransferase/poly(A) polymerase
MNFKQHIPEPVRKLDSVLSRFSVDSLVRVAGGAVRDLLAGAEPKDWDLATPLRPEVVMQQAEEAGFKVLPTGLQHGTVTVMVDGEPLEVTTLRIDVETDGRHADVEFTTDWKEDAARRDLTVNAMFLTMDGEVVDFFGGQQDLEDGRVRFVGDARERMAEDFLRILRFFRFQGRVGSGKFDEQDLQAIHDSANGLASISGERIWMEMSKILTGQILRQVLGAMEDSSVLRAIGIDNPNFALAEMANTMDGDATVVLAGLLGGDAATAKKVAARWKLTKKERTLLLWLTEQVHEMHANSFRFMELVDWQKLAVTHGKDQAMALTRLTPYQGIRDELDKWMQPEFPVTGADILNLGVEPGPDVGRKMRAAKQAWLDSDFKMDKQQLLQLAASA